MSSPTPPAPSHFLIAGATGRQGSAVISALLSHPTIKTPPSSIWAITRSASSPPAQTLLSKYPHINLLVGNLNTPSSLFQSLGLGPANLSRTAVFLAQTHGPTEVDEAKGFIDAARENGVGYFVYSSVDRGGREVSDVDPSYCKTFEDKFLIEKYLIGGFENREKGRGLGYTILRPVWFVDNAWWGFAGRLCMAGWKVWMRGKRMQVVTTSYLGRWAAEALLQPDQTSIRNQAVSIASEELSFQDFDDLFKKRTGKGVPVTYWWLAVLMILLVKDLRTMFGFIYERDYGADLEWLGERLRPDTVEEWIEGIEF